MELTNINKGKDVLVVDDCEDNQLLMELLLQNEGYQVRSASNGIRGLTAVEQQLPDLIILDLMMPDISGLEVVRRLKHRCHLSSIPIILLTANLWIRHQDVKEVDAVCHKPFDIYKLLEKIQSVLTLPVAV